MKQQGQQQQESKSKALIPIASWTSLGVLLLVYISNQLTRNILPYTVNFDPAVVADPAAAREFINVALNFNAVSYGVLASFGFTLLFSLCSLIAGRTVDTWSKKNSTVLACLAWSLSTAGQGLANSFDQV